MRGYKFKLSSLSMNKINFVDLIKFVLDIFHTKIFKRAIILVVMIFRNESHIQPLNVKHF